MQGKRLPDGTEISEECGAYWKNPRGHWMAYGPVDFSGPIRLTGHHPDGGHAKDWNVIEHEDGTITVSPSIRILGAPGQPDTWHGHLIRGEWRTC